MKRLNRATVVIIACLGLNPVLAFSEQTKPSLALPADQRIMKEVRHGLVMLPFYDVFDDLAYKVDGTTVTLMGYVTRPTLKSSAEQVAKQVAGVEKVINQIEVLPLSPMDDRIRCAVYFAVYRTPGLSRYALQAVPPIHIVVKNGHVTLTGTVFNKMEKTLTELKTLGVAGVFSVTNHLNTERT